MFPGLPKLSEADIQRTCTEYLEMDGWRALRTDPVSRREWGKGFGELGMADCLYIRYDPERHISPAHRKPAGATGGFQQPSWMSRVSDDVYAEVMWIEWKKARAKKAMRHQTDWHAREAARGAITLIARRDFPASIEGFRTWYAQSGLRRQVK